IVFFLRFEGVVADVTPEDGSHPKFVRTFKSRCYFLYLTSGLVRSEVDSSTDGNGAQVPGIFHRSKHNLVVFVRMRQKLVVVYFDDEGNLVSILSRDHRQRSIRSGHSVTTAFNG